MKLSSLSYKKRNVYLAIASVLFLCIAYVTTIQKTVDLYRRNAAIETSIARYSGTAVSLEQLRTKFNDLDNFMKMYSLDSIRNQQYLMSEVSDLCRLHNLTLKNFPKATVTVENDLVVETNVIETEGTFIDNVQLIYALETIKKIGRISSVNFLSHVDNRTKKTTLTMTLYLQNVRKNNGSVKI